MFAGLFYLQKWMKQAEMKKRSEQGLIQTADRMRIGLKDELVLVKVGNEYLLYSSASGSFVKLETKEFPEMKPEFSEYFHAEKLDVFQQIKRKVNEVMVKK